jgi:diguanylate cyclase (GGDEF)-like protein
LSSDDTVLGQGLDAPITTVLDTPILLVETPKSGASYYAERIRQALADCPFSHSRQITASFGIASLPEDSLASSEALIRAAAEALYAAKRDGKNSVASYEPEPTFAQAQQD